MKNIRQTVATIACLIGGVFLLGKTFLTSPPDRSSLEEFRGSIEEVLMETRETRRSSYTYPAIRIHGHDEPFKYLDWFPSPEEIESNFFPGDQVVLLSDADRNRWIWEIQKGDETMVNYEDVLMAVKENGKYDPVLGGGLLVVGLGGVAFRYRAIRKKGSNK